MKIDGRCHCGFITYEADIVPNEVMCVIAQTVNRYQGLLFVGP